MSELTKQLQRNALRSDSALRALRYWAFAFHIRIFHYATSPIRLSYGYRAHVSYFFGGIVNASATYSPVRDLRLVQYCIFLMPRNLSNLSTQMSVTEFSRLDADGDRFREYRSFGVSYWFCGRYRGVSLTRWNTECRVILLAIVVGVAIGIFHGTLTAILNIPLSLLRSADAGVARCGQMLLGGNTILSRAMPSNRT